MSRTKLRRGKDGKLEVERFSLIRRLEHTLVAVSFFALLLTGVPQKFETSSVGHFIVTVFGGIDNARLIHRIAGIVFSIHAVLHIGAVAVGVALKKMRLTLMPIPQDVRDAWENMRWYLGYRKDSPPLPKFDYKQKFEYMGLILGGLVMIFSGLVLLFAADVARLLPGEVIPVAVVLHSSEAMLALSVLLVWHTYGAVLSPDVFPIDKSIFTGYMPAEHLAHHHKREYDLLFPEGEPKEPEPKGKES